MGILKDLLDKGLISQDDYTVLANEFTDEFFGWRHNLDPRDLDRIIDMLEELGAKDLAEDLTENLLKCTLFWHDELLEKKGIDVYYDPYVRRWRDWETGRFVAVSTYWVRD
jgi:hypothetical protein